MKNLDKYTNEIDSISNKCLNDLQDLGDKIRTEVVMPACKKHKLKFMSGNGTFFFSKGDQDFTQTFDLSYHSASKALRKTLEPILDILNIEISHNDYIGFYVGDVE